MEGLDVSSWQGVIDWARVAAAFVIVRVAHGSTPDPRAVENLRGAIAAGKIVGAYQYLEPGVTWQEHADAFLETLDGIEVAFVAIDIEDPHLVPGEAAFDALAWLRYVGHPCAYVYTGLEPAARLHLADVPELGEWPLWVAHYGVRKPGVPGPWTSWAVWQRSGSGRANGVRGPVDIDVLAEGCDLR